MKLSTILSILLWALVLTALSLLSSCSKGRNTNAFNIYFYTTNKQMPPLWLEQNGRVLGKMPVLNQDPIQLDSAVELLVTCYDVSTEIDGVDAKGNVVEMFNYTLNNNGSYKEGGGGYLLYDTWQKEPFNLLIRINGQFQ